MVASPQSPTSPGGWTACGSNTKPGGRGHENVPWLRTRLPGPEVAQPTLYFLIVEQIFEAYLDGEPLYHFGQLDGEGPGGVASWQSHAPHLAAARLCRTHADAAHLFWRCRHRHLWASADLVGPRRHLRHAARRRQPGGVGIVLCAIGLLAIGLYLPQRKDPTYLSYGGFALCMGLWLLCQMGCRTTSSTPRWPGSPSRSMRSTAPSPAWFVTSTPSLAAGRWG